MKKLLLFINIFFILNAGNIKQLEKYCNDGDGVACYNLEKMD